MAKKDSPSPSDVARRIWLAGVGAYGKAFSDAQESLAKVGEDTSRRFEELVARGEEIEGTIDEKRREVVDKLPAHSFSLDDRLQEMRQRLGLVAPAGAGHGDDLDERLSRLEEKVDQILTRLNSTSAASPARKTTKKKTTKKSRSKSTG